MLCQARVWAALALPSDGPVGVNVIFWDSEAFALLCGVGWRLLQILYFLFLPCFFVLLISVY